MNSDEICLYQSISNSINIALRLGIDMDNLKHKINSQIEISYIPKYRSSTKNKKKSKKKPIRTPLWISDSSNDEN